MPVFDQSFEESVSTDDERNECTMLLISGCVVVGESSSARYSIRTEVMNPFEYWVIELTRSGKTVHTILLMHQHLQRGISIIDHSEEDRYLFPPYDVATTITREQAFAKNLTEEIFALIDEICLNDDTVRENHEYWIRQLFYHNLGPFYVEDALRLAPRLQRDQVPCEYFIDFEEQWQSVSWEQLKQIGLREVCSIMIPREHEGTASYHESKVFPEGTLYYHESDPGGDGWHDETTQYDVEMLEKMHKLHYEKADLERQKVVLLGEIAEVEREIMDPEANWRLHALQQAQRANRQRLAIIERSLQEVEQRIEEIP